MSIKEWIKDIWEWNIKYFFTDDLPDWFNDHLRGCLEEKYKKIKRRVRLKIYLYREGIK